MVWHRREQGHLWPRSERRRLEAALSWQHAPTHGCSGCSPRPRRQPALTHSLCATRARLHPPPARWGHPGHRTGVPREVHPPHYKHLCRIKAGWEGSCPPPSTISGVTLPEPHEAGAGREAASPGERENATKFRFWEALGCSSSLPQTSRLGSEPGTSLARGQAALAGQGNHDKGIFVSPACLLLHPSPGVTPTRWSHLSTENLLQHFPDAVSPRQDLGLPSPLPCPQPFPRHQPRSRAGEPEAIKAGFGCYLLNQVFALILPGADSSPSPPVSPRSGLASHPVRPFPSAMGLEAMESTVCISSSLFRPCLRRKVKMDKPQVSSP